MGQAQVDLIGQVCPYPVVSIIRAVVTLGPGQAVGFLVDDPLALKSVPEELDEIGEFRVEIVPHGDAWEIIVRRRDPSAL